MNDRIIASIRTTVAAAVAAVLVWGTNTFGFDVGSVPIEAGAVVFVTGIYNAIVNALAAKWPYFGYLLGIPVNPSYTKVYPL